jgi:hypothetical protein
MREFRKSVVLCCVLLVTLYVGSYAQTPNYQQNTDLTGNWVVSGASSLPDGAIYFTSDKINPYVGNLAAIGLTKNRAYHPQLKAWMEWYIAHLNYPDKRGLYCTMYDYHLSGTTETPLNDADSTDSYAASFLSLAWTFWPSGDANVRAYIRTLAYQLDSIGGVMVQTQQSTGLTLAKPDYPFQLLMDNAEVYKGMRDVASLSGAFEDPNYPNAKQRYNDHAALVFNGIRDNLWDQANANYLWYVGAPPSDWTVWYPDSTAQLFPVLHGVIPPSDPRAQTVYTTFNTEWPNALMGDADHVNKCESGRNQLYEHRLPLSVVLRGGGMVHAGEQLHAGPETVLETPARCAAVFETAA